MISDSIQAIILAAGKSNRFHTPSNKLLAPLCGQEMILYTTKLLASLNIPTTIVIGFQGDKIKEVVQKHHHDSISFVYQTEQCGTGHAVAQTEPIWQSEHILILNGDMPLITQSIIQQLITQHYKHNATITFATAHYADPLSHYGRVIKHGDLLKVVEAKDCTPEMHESCCINAGVYVIKKSFLQQHIHELSDNNASGEYYITDLINIANKNNYILENISVSFDQIRGINTLKEHWTAEQIKRSELISTCMDHGVRFHMAQSTHLDINVTIGSGSSIGAGVYLTNGTTIGANCSIGPFTILDNAHIADNVTVHSHCVIQNTTIDKDCSVRPFTHLQDQYLSNTSSSTKIADNDIHSFVGATKVHQPRNLSE